MYCENCGKEVDGKFCGNCGKEVDDSVVDVYDLANKKEVKRIPLPLKIVLTVLADLAILFVMLPTASMLFDSEILRYGWYSLSFPLMATVLSISLLYLLNVHNFFIKWKFKIVAKIIIAVVLISLGIYVIYLGQRPVIPNVDLFSPYPYY